MCVHVLGPAFRRCLHSKCRCARIGLSFHRRQHMRPSRRDIPLRSTSACGAAWTAASTRVRTQCIPFARPSLRSPPAPSALQPPPLPLALPPPPRRPCVTCGGAYACNLSATARIDTIGNAHSLLNIPSRCRRRPGLRVRLGAADDVPGTQEGSDESALVAAVLAVLTGRTVAPWRHTRLSVPVLVQHTQVPVPPCNVKQRYTVMGVNSCQASCTSLAEPRGTRSLAPRIHRAYADARQVQRRARMHN